LVGEALRPFDVLGAERPGVREYRFNAPVASVVPGIGTDREARTPWLMACNR
jgi:hypothetical protein